MNTPLYSSMDGTSALVIREILRVLFPTLVTLADPTYGRGQFYRKFETAIRLYGGDLDPARARNWCGDCRRLPFADSSIDVVVLDPPFQPISTNTSVLIGQQYTKIGVPGQSMANLRAVKEFLLLAAREAHRVSRLGTIVKTQDYIHARTRVPMSAWIHEALGHYDDHVTLRQRSKLRSSSGQTQCSVWSNHSDFWVYLKGSRYHAADRARKRKSSS